MFGINWIIIIAEKKTLIKYTENLRLITKVIYLYLDFKKEAQYSENLIGLKIMNIYQNIYLLFQYVYLPYYFACIFRSDKSFPKAHRKIVFSVIKATNSP